ncbi:MAG TPA: J domain-containing protein [Thermoanaerobaculia bacterium]|nr:J domain-containing protein [Thermoanaerobaculia bacterium]
MELVAVIFMIVVGCGVAVGVMVAIGVATKHHENGGQAAEMHGRSDRERIAGSILFQILLAGGTQPDAALRDIRRKAGIGSPVTAGVDVGNWGEAFAQVASRSEREGLLETAVQLIASRGTPVPLRQYAALLDLSFGLGFQTDALARLRVQYGFEYIDHAKDARPAEADRAAGRLSLFARDEREPGELLRVLGIEDSSASRQIIIAAYRRLVAQHHPDRYHEQSADAQAGAAARFIEITRAYETLLSMYRE